MDGTTVVIRWTGDNAQVISAADNVNSAIDSTINTAKNAGGSFDILGELATGALHRIGEAAINAVGSGLSMLGDFFTSSIDEAAGWQSVFAQTEAVVTSTGGAAGRSATELANLAGALSAANGQSIFSDDAILGAENVLATFTQIKGASFDDATQAILDISQAMGQDLQSSAVQVGKALNDPMAGVSALSRVGVTFSDDQKAVIESLQMTGDMAGAQAIIIAELNKEFGGSAAAAVDTYAGQMTVLSEQFNDVKQNVGEALLPILERLSSFAVEKLVPAVDTLASAFVAWVDSVDWVGLESLLGDVFTGISDAITSVDWDATFAMIGQGIEWVMLTAGDLKVTFDQVIGAIMTQVNGFWAVVGPIWAQFVEVLNQAWTELQPLGAVFAEAMGEISAQGEAMAPIGEYIGNIVKAMLNVVGNLITVLVPVIKFVFPLIVAYVQDVITGFMNLYNAINYVFSGQLQKDIGKWWDDTITKITGSITTVIDKAKQMGKDIMRGVIDGVESMADKLRNAFSAIVNGAVDWLKKLLGIASPSKVLAEAVDVPMMQGIITGVQSGVPAMQRALTDVSGVAIATTTSSTQNYYLTANYAQMQTESNVATTLRIMQLQAGG